MSPKLTNSGRKKLECSERACWRQNSKRVLIHLLGLPACGQQSAAPRAAFSANLPHNYLILACRCGASCLSVLLLFLAPNLSMAKL